MRYMFLLYVPGRDASDSPAGRAAFAAIASFHDECRRRAALVASGPLAPPQEAATVRVAEGRTLTTDGPFAETKEWLGGYFVVECDDLDDALELAAACPIAHDGAVEVRPVVQRSGARAGEQDGNGRFVLLIHDLPGGLERLPAPEREAASADYLALARAPEVTAGAQLQAATSATTVRVRDGRVLTTDGPFAETKEQIGGYYVVAVPAREAAVALAARIPAARMGGAVEVRPLLGGR